MQQKGWKGGGKAPRIALGQQQQPQFQQQQQFQQQHQAFQPPAKRMRMEAPHVENSKRD